MFMNIFLFFSLELLLFRGDNVEKEFLTRVGFGIEETHFKGRCCSLTQHMTTLSLHSSDSVFLLIMLFSICL